LWFTPACALTCAATASRRAGGTAIAASVLAPAVLGRNTGPMRSISPRLLSCPKRWITSSSSSPQSLAIVAKGRGTSGKPRCQALRRR
jgi:hypothetical protein